MKWAARLAANARDMWLRQMTKTVLITGAGARVGAALAKGLAEDGWNVVIHYFRSAEKADMLASDIKAAGGKAFTVQANLSVPQECDTLIERAAEAAGGPITALINNASTFDEDTAADFSRATYDFHMNANLRAPLILSQHFADQAGKGGVIINMVDQRVLKPNPKFFTYTLSKASLHWATTTMAQAFAPKVRVNAIGPGPVLQNRRQSGAEFEKETRETLLGHGSPPETLLQAVRYLLEATSVTGQFLAVDSGQHLRWETPDIMIGER